MSIAAAAILAALSLSQQAPPVQSASGQTIPAATVVPAATPPELDGATTTRSGRARRSTPTSASSSPRSTSIPRSGPNSGRLRRAESLRLRAHVRSAPRQHHARAVAARRARAVGPDQAPHRLVQRQAQRLRVRREPGRREARLRDEQRRQRGRLVERRVGRRDRASTRSAGRPSSASRSRSFVTRGADAHTFGFGIWRDIERYRERSQLAALVARREAASPRSSAGSTGCPGISTTRRLEVTPYIVTKNVQRTHAERGLRARAADRRAAATSSSASRRTSRSTRR